MIFKKTKSHPKGLDDIQKANVSLLEESEKYLLVYKKKISVYSQYTEIFILKKTIPFAVLPLHDIFFPEFVYGY